MAGDFPVGAICVSGATEFPSATCCGTRQGSRSETRSFEPLYRFGCIPVGVASRSDGRTRRLQTKSLIPGVFNPFQVEAGQFQVAGPVFIFLSPALFVEGVDGPLADV